MVASNTSSSSTTTVPISEDSTISNNSQSKGTTNSTQKLPWTVIAPAAFVDTISILVLFTLFPSLFMAMVHGIFVSTRSSAVTFRALFLDTLCAITSLYLTPLFKNLVIIFAHAIVAAYLGGGNKVFTNAIYSTLLLETIQTIYNNVNMFFFPDENILPTKLIDSDDIYGTQLFSMSNTATTNPSDTFNTFTSGLALLSNGYNSMRHLNWTYELPRIIYQVAAIHVVGLGLLPFVRKVFPAEKTSSSSSSATHSAMTIDTPIEGNTPDLTSSSVDFSDNNYQGTVISIAESNSATDEILFDENSNNSRSPAPFKLLYPNNNNTTSTTAMTTTATTATTTNTNTNTTTTYNNSTRRNKRLTTVKSNQPLWSTLASSMVLAARQESLKETDSFVNQVVAESKQQNLGQSVITEAPDNNNNADSKQATGNNQNQHHQFSGRCYVKFVQENNIGFYMVSFEKNWSKNFLARVNGIQWPQVSVQQAEAEQVASDKNYSDPFVVIVSGLTPFTQYEIEIAAEDPDTRLVISCLKANICTSIKSNLANNNYNQSTNGPMRPLSPVTTLLDTLTTTQITLSEEKSRLKRLRKEHTKRLTSLRSEIDAIKSKVESADKGDERNRRKVLSLRESVRQYEEEIDQLTKSTEKLLARQEEVANAFPEHEERHENQMELVKQKKQELDKIREQNATQIFELDSEWSSLMTKRDKLLAKKYRLESELGNFTTPYEEDIEKEHQLRKQEREQKIERRKKVQAEFSTSITKMENSLEETKRKTENLWASVQQQQQKVVNIPSF